MKKNSQAIQNTERNVSYFVVKGCHSDINYMFDAFLMYYDSRFCSYSSSKFET